eukprot:720331_1
MGAGQSNLDSLVAKLDSKSCDSKLNVIVFYRGDWDSTCERWIKHINKHLEPFVRAQDGKIVAVCSASQEEVDNVIKTEAAWDLRLDVIGDPEHSLAKYLRENELLDVLIDIREKPEKKRRSSGSKPDMFAKPASDSFTQPALFVFSGRLTELVDHPERIVYHWRSEPRLINLNGRFGRPSGREILKAIMKGFARARARSYNVPSASKEPSEAKEPSENPATPDGEANAAETPKPNAAKTLMRNMSRKFDSLKTKSIKNKSDSFQTKQ